jgi:hypothetical protein
MMHHAIKLLAQFGGKHQTAFGVDATGVFSEQVEHGVKSATVKVQPISHFLPLIDTFSHFVDKV